MKYRRAKSQIAFYRQRNQEHKQRIQRHNRGHRPVDHVKSHGRTHLHALTIGDVETCFHSHQKCTAAEALDLDLGLGKRKIKEWMSWSAFVRKQPVSSLSLAKRVYWAAFYRSSDAAR
jgi:hypothetical protein